MLMLIKKLVLFCVAHINTIRRGLSIGAETLEGSCERGEWAPFFIGPMVSALDSRFCRGNTSCFVIRTKAHRTAFSIIQTFIFENLPESHFRKWISFMAKFNNAGRKDGLFFLKTVDLRLAPAVVTLNSVASQNYGLSMVQAAKVQVNGR